MHVSSRPGKTQTINFYLVNNDFYLVDAPGYGYASLTKKKQMRFGMMVEEYLASRPNLKEVFMLIDFRHKPTEYDLMMYDFLKYHDKRVTVVATKVDKVSVNQREKNKRLILDTLDLVIGDSLIMFSNVTKDGKKEAHAIIERYLDFVDVE